ncbi:MAG: ABC transporter ATP-binding protein [Actinomycetota bacterium]
MAVDVTTPEPTGRYQRPRAGVDRDRSRWWLRRLQPVIAQQRWQFIGATVIGFLGMGATVAVPLILGRGVDAIEAEESIAPYVVALGVLAVARFLLGFIYRFGLFRAALRIEADLRNLMYEQLTRLSFDFWDRTQSGQVISRANSDIRSIQLLFAFGPLVVMQLVLFVLAVIVMLSVDVTLTLVAIAPLPIVYAVGVRLRNRSFPLQWLVTARQAEMATIVDENIQGIRVVKAFNQEPAQVTNLARATRRLRWAGTEVAKTRARHSPWMEALPRAGLAFVLLYGGLQTIDGNLAIGDLVAFSTYVVLLATPFRLMGFILIQWQRAGAAAIRVFEILDETPSISEPDDPVALDEPAGRIEFDDVHFAYPVGDGDPVLRGFTATIEAGESVAIVGATGSGKSTLARLLTRFYDTGAGVVRVDGHDVRTLSLRDLRTAVSTVTEDPFLFAMSVAGNVAFARPDASAEVVSAALSDAAALEFVQDLPESTGTVVGERGMTLSGGQRQRIAIARTLVANPAVLIFDDATSAIDVAVEERIHEALAARRTDRTTVLIAHRLSTIALADRVILLDDGVVAATGTHEELLAGNARYAEILADATKPDVAAPDGAGERA